MSKKEIQIISEQKTAAEAIRRMAEVNAAVWAESRLHLSNGRRFSFADHRYQVEPMSMDHPKLTVKKATQLGFTEIFLDKVFHALVHHKWPMGAIYMFPTDEKVCEFSDTRVVPLIRKNRESIGQFVASTNNKHDRQVGDAWLMFRGARLSQRIEGLVDESISLRSDPADVVVADELDLMPPAALGEARERTAHSDFRYDWALSNPTIPKYGIDARWLDSDQRHWMIPCRGCNEWWSPDVEFPSILRRLPDARVVMACLRCGREIDRTTGQWVVKYPSRTKEHVGWWGSQLISRFVSLGEILSAFENPPENNRAAVMRFKLGRAFLEAQYGLTQAEVLLCCTTDPPMNACSTPTAIGVDVGKRLHVVIGQRIRSDSFRIVAVLLLDGWQELHQVAIAFHAEVTCIDNEPELRGAREYQATGPGEIWLSDYIQSVQPAHYDMHSRVIKVNRTEILDATHFYIRTPGKLLLPSATSLVQQFATECANMAKVVSRKPRSGDQLSMYVQTGPDHFRHGFANFLLAARRLAPIMGPSTDDSEHRPGQRWELW